MLCFAVILWCCGVAVVHCWHNVCHLRLFCTVYRMTVFSVERMLGLQLRRNLCWMLWICTVSETG